MKKIFLLLTVVAAFAFTSAPMLIQQKKAAPAAMDPNAKTLLDAVSQHYKAIKSIRATFKLSMEHPNMKTKQEKRGALVLKGTKYIIQLDNQDIYCDGKTVWTYSKESNEVQVNNYEHNAHEVNPSEIFTMYEKGFIYQMAEVDAAKGLQVVELTPTDKKKAYFKIKLFVNKAEKSIQKMKIFNNNGGFITYDIVQFTANPKDVTDASFVFDAKKYPGVEVNDIR